MQPKPPFLFIGLTHPKFGSITKRGINTPTNYIVSEYLEHNDYNRSQVKIDLDEEEIREAVETIDELVQNYNANANNNSSANNVIINTMPTKNYYRIMIICEVIFISSAVMFICSLRCL